MLLLKRTGELLLLAGIIFLSILVLFDSRIHLPLWLQVAGRMHPVFLHFPITLLLIYFISFWIPSAHSAWPWFRTIGFIAVISAMVTAIMGVLLSMQGTYEGITFQRHKWGGISIAVISVIIYYLQPLLMRRTWWGRGFSLGVALLVLTTGHWGGKLTHGEDYLLEPYATLAANVAPSEAIAFRHIIGPILEQKCASCHNEGSSKGGLSLSDTAGLLRGGKTGPFMLAGDPGKSLFLERISLPSDNKKHMAPASKPQVTDEEFQLLTAWVKSGAPLNRKIIDLPEQDSFRLMAVKHLSPAENTEQQVFDFPAASEKTIESLNNNYRLVTPLGAGSPALRVQFFGSKAFTPKSLEELMPIKQQITELSVARMPVRNEDLKLVGQMVNLQQLNINYTDINDEGIRNLTSLKKLTEITLSGTKVTAAALAQLITLPDLKELYAWNISVDSSAVAGVQIKNKQVRIESGYRDDGSELLPLNPPVAEKAGGVYPGGTTVKLSHPMKSVQIRYTLNQQEPDSVNSPVYTTPFTLDSFTVVKARAFKPGWYGSKTLKASYFIKGPKPDSVLLETKEEENLSRKGMLFDGITGDENVETPKWMRISKPFTCYMLFDEPVTLHQLWLNAFVRGETEIYLPKQMQIWGGMDKQNMVLLKTWTTGPFNKKGKPEMVQPTISFAEKKIKYLKFTIEPWEIKKENPRSYISEIILR